MRMCAVAVIAALTMAGGVATAAEPEAEAEAESGEAAGGGWQFAVTPYLWITGASGKATVGDETVHFEQTVGDTFDLLGSLEAGGLMAHIDARKGDLGVFVDFAFLAINTSSDVGPAGRGSARVKMLEYFVEYGATYRVLEYPTSLESPIWVEVLAGGRWNRMSTELAFSRLPNDRKSKIEFMDPLVGGRFGVPFYGSEGVGEFGILARGDIGGFGAGSDLSWSAIGGLRWDMPWTMAGADLSLIAGYKTYYFKTSEETDGVSTSLAVQSGGPAVGLSGSF